MFGGIKIDIESQSSPISGSFGCFAWEKMLGHAVSDKPITFTSLILGTPNLAQFIYHFLTFYFFLTYFTVITFTSASWGFSDPRVSSFFILSIFTNHWRVVLVFYSYQGFRPASVSQPLFNESCVKSLLFQCLLDLIDIFVLLVGSLMSFKSMFLSKNMFFSSNLVISLSNILLYQWLLIFNLQTFHG